MVYGKPVFSCTTKARIVRDPLPGAFIVGKAGKRIEVVTVQKDTAWEINPSKPAVGLLLPTCWDGRMVIESIEKR